MSPLYEWSAPRRRKGLRDAFRVWGGWFACAAFVSMLSAQAGSSIARRAGVPARAAFERVRAQAAQLHTRRVAVLPLANGLLHVRGRATPDALPDLALRVVAQAEAGGLRVAVFEPLPPSGAATGAVLAAHPFRLRAAGRFSSVQRWLARLPELPALLEPASLDIRPGAEDSVTLDAIVHLHADLPGDVLRGVASPVSAHGREADDADAPNRFEVLDSAFRSLSSTEFAAPSASVWELSGVVADAVHRLALLERGAQSVVVAPGQTHEDLRVIQLGAAGARIEQHGATPQRIVLRGAVGQ